MKLLAHLYGCDHAAGCYETSRRAAHPRLAELHAKAAGWTIYPNGTARCPAHRLDPTWQPSNSLPSSPR